MEANYNSYKEYRQASIENKLFSKEVLLIAEGLPMDGNYNIDKFRYLPTPAPFVRDGNPIPEVSSKQCYLYIANEELI